MAIRLVRGSLLLVVVRVGLAMVIRLRMSIRSSDMGEWQVVVFVAAADIWALDSLVVAASLLDLQSSAASGFVQTPMSLLEVVDGCFTVAAVVGVALAAAAADGEEPEEGSEECESCGQPRHGQSMGAGVERDAIVVESFLESLGQDGEHDGGGDGGAEAEDGGNLVSGVSVAFFDCIIGRRLTIESIHVKKLNQREKMARMPNMTAARRSHRVAK